MNELQRAALTSELPRALVIGVAGEREHFVEQYYLG